MSRRHQSHAETKKEKKKALHKKNRLHQEIFFLARLRRGEAERVSKLAPGRGRKPEPGGKEGQWSDKVSSVRNRLTGKKRESKERWNRFAGTSDAGGRGL